MNFFAVSSVATAWVVLFTAGLLEIVFAFSMRWSAGFTRLVPSLLCISAGITSVWMLSLTLKYLPLGTAYAVWAGIGAAGTALVGIVWLGESASLGRLLCLALVVLGIVGLQLQSKG